MATEYCFTVNGMRRTTTEKKSLLRYLRDDLHLFSVKDGCSEGACGTCTIIVDGVAVKACVLTTDKSVGRNIVTVEGLTEREQDAFVYAFGSKGSVQCGFCIPGMVMAGKALIDQNPDPTEEEIKYALRGNICRCTGYKKIIEGIQLTAAILRGDAEIDYDLERGEQYGVGQRAFRVDVRKKVLGYGKYPDDIVMDGMVHLSAVRSKYPRARVLKIDASKAEALPGVLGVLTAKDVPNNKVGHIQQDWDVMIAEGDITRMIGDTICVVVAETEEILEKAKANGLLGNRTEKDLTEKEIFNFITVPGFSTKKKVTEYSGRGVGMDVVVKNIQQVGGVLDIESVEGQGSTMTMKIPLTLAIIDGIIFSVGETNFVTPTNSVTEFIRIEKDKLIVEPDGEEYVMIREECYPLIRLNRFYHLDNAVEEIDEGIVIILNHEDRKLAVFADRLAGEQEIVVKPIPSYVKKVKGISGCTQLGDGSISLILDTGGLVMN